MRTIVRDSDPALTARALANAILREGFASEPSLYASVVAHALAVRIVRAMGNPAQTHAPVEWVDRTCASVPLEPRVGAMIRGAAASARRFYRASPHDGDVFTIIAAGIDAVLDRQDASAASRPVFEDETDATIAAFLIRLEDADPLSAEHSRAVSLWCRRLAVKLELDEDACRFAARSGLLHDVGKSRTPFEILNAPRALSESEWQIMRDHTVAGAELLARVERLRPFEVAARSHHERLDGKGHPDRLAAADIPQFVRIVTVADSFNAMIGRRPYRLPLSPSQALEQLQRHRATQFDPEIVAAMIDIVEQKTAV